MRENGYNAAGLVLLAQNLIRSSDWYKGRQDCSVHTSTRILGSTTGSLSGAVSGRHWIKRLHTGFLGITGNNNVWLKGT